jgi:photosystem II stability/assembly factor-like uncharacterized protein
MKNYFTKLFASVIIFSSCSFAQPFWNPGEGPYGGTILDFAFNSQGHIYGAGFFGLYRSVDNGQNWEPVGAQFLSNFFQLNAVAIDQMDNIFVGTFAGIIKSTDNGLTWAPANNGLTNLNINTIEVNSSGVLFAGTFSNAARSTDGGANWTIITNGLQQNTSVLDFTIDKTSGEIFTGTTSGAYSSTNNGDNWVNISSGLPSGTAINSVDLSPEGRSGGNYLYAGTTQGVYRYDRLLQNWLFLATGLGAAYIYALVVNFQGDIFAATAFGVFRHLASANQWTQLNIALIFSYVTALAITQQGYLLAGEDWGGPLLSMNNGDTWIRIIAGLTAYGILSFYYSHALGKFFIGTDAGYFKGLAALTGWLLMYPQGFPFFMVTATVYAAGFLFAARYFQGIYRSSDEGLTWQQVNNGLTNLYVTAIVVTALGHLYAATQGGGVHFSDNNGDNWVPVNAGLTSVLITTLYLSAAGILYAGTLDAGVFSFNFSTNQWTQLTLTGLTALYITSIVVNSFGDIFAGTYGGGIFKLAFGASSWIALGIAATIIYDLVLRSQQARGAEEIYAGTPAGVYYSTNDGSVWNQINNGLGGNLAAVKFASDSDGEIYVAVNGGGIFKGGGGPNFIEVVNNTVPDKYFLKQNYPNPFNPSTTISFDLPVESFVTLEIFNALGEKADVLVSENLSAGTYNYYWEAGNLPGGAYFCRLSSGNFVETKKLMLIK